MTESLLPQVNGVTNTVRPTVERLLGTGHAPTVIAPARGRAGPRGSGGIPAAVLLQNVDTVNLRMRRRAVDLALEVAGRLHLQGAGVRVYDPEANNNARAVFPALTYVASTRAALAGADLVLHVTDWPEFAAVDPDDAGRLVLDLPAYRPGLAPCHHVRTDGVAGRQRGPVRPRFLPGRRAPGSVDPAGW